ncbi:MAG: FecR domain-containing protein [Paludibacterium sp.]|uniref:FecR family protein n=1 Tax=Paludibacterium sp. TaxID=1917523 RepID=UPI0025D29AFE|nr:FecR domain-containing protein [Paludibacterium sp.]MBV8046575.1 FecR domain-containing protein [Paludibacterium sp.]
MMKRLRAVACLALLALAPSVSGAAASCAFDAQGRQTAPLASPAGEAPLDGGWGGVGGTGARTASSAPRPDQDQAPGWGGIGGTGVRQAPPAPAEANARPNDSQEGWGGMGGTGVTRAPASQPHLAGYVLFARGSVTARQGSLPARRLAQGDAVCEGDAVATSEQDGTLQLRMADRGAVMLYPGSTLRIDTFKLPAQMDGSERLAMTLEQGGMRAMTGDIGHVNKANYLIQTPAAQIHIRGTDHEVFYVPATGGRFGTTAPGTYNHVISGGTTLSTATGSVRLDPAQSGFAPLTDIQPAVIEALPEVLRAMPLKAALRLNGKTAKLANDISALIASPVVSPVDPLANPLPNQIISHNVTFDFSNNPVDSPDLSAYVGVTYSGGSIALGAIDGNTDQGWQIGVDPQTGLPLYAVMNDGSILFYVDGDTVQPVSFQSTTIDGATVYWGVYNGGASSDAYGDWQFSNLHAYAFSPGGSTPLSVVQNMSGTLTYSTVVGATAPIDENGNMGGQINSLSASVTFGANPTVNSYAINVTDGQSRVWNAASTQGVSLADFKNGAMTLAGSCNGCQGGSVSGNANGVLIGAHAGGMISGYNLQTNQNESVSGVAVLKH